MMPRLHRIFRTLQWLALFQLLGGPLVLGALMLVIRSQWQEPADVAALPDRMIGAITEMRRIEAGLIAGARHTDAKRETANDPARREAPSRPPDSPKQKSSLDPMPPAAVADWIPRGPEIVIVAAEPAPPWQVPHWDWECAGPPSPPPRCV